MRYATAALFVMVASLTHSMMLQEQPNSERSAQDSSTAIHPQVNVIPDKFVNLQVLPKDIAKPRLVNVMKQFSITFGVRCSYCHTVSDDLTEGSFDSDDKETKRKARELVKAILEMNAQSSGN